MTAAEKRVLFALAQMCDQYLVFRYPEFTPPGAAPLEHSFVGAGQRAIKILADYGLVELNFKGGVWTEAGRALLNSD